MSLSLSCTCGARFEVEETFAGQEVACPECHQALRAPRQDQAPRRTSGFAIASVILAVAGTFTIVGTLLAVLLGGLALVTIARHRQRFAGAGFAIFGIVWGLVFTGVSIFAYSQSDLFGLGGQLRERSLKDQVNYEGPLEVIRRGHDFAITRPSEKWGVVEGTLEPFPWPHDPDLWIVLTLIHLPTNAQVDVTHQRVGHDTLDQCQDRVLSWFNHNAGNPKAAGQVRLIEFKRCKVHRNQKLPARGIAEVAELHLDVQLAGESRTYLVRLVKAEGDLFVIRGWANRRRFAEVEANLKKALDSFRLLEE